MASHPHRLTAYLLLVALLAASVALHLGPSVLAGLLSYTILDLTYRPLAARTGRTLISRWLALAIFTVTAVLASLAFWRFMKQSLHTVPAILTKVVPRIVELGQRYSVDLPFENIEELKTAMVRALRENAGDLPQVGGLVTQGFFHVLVGIFVAILLFMTPLSPSTGGRTLFDCLRAEFDGCVRRFMTSFEKVLGAQVAISTVNTILTAVFLLFLGFPFAAFLIPATFILGILPIVGNIMSNTIIVAAGMALSLRHGVFALAFLVFIHKAEYILNSRIVGSSIQAPMWQTLLGILLGEAVLGIPGIILAPALWHFVRGELQAAPGRP